MDLSLSAATAVVNDNVARKPLCHNDFAADPSGFVALSVWAILASFGRFDLGGIRRQSSEPMLDTNQHPPQYLRSPRERRSRNLLN
jgi:hypothetical protein